MISFGRRSTSSSSTVVFLDPGVSQHAVFNIYPSRVVGRQMAIKTFQRQSTQCKTTHNVLQITMKKASRLRGKGVEAAGLRESFQTLTRLEVPLTPRRVSGWKNRCYEGQIYNHICMFWSVKLTDYKSREFIEVTVLPWILMKKQ